MNPLYLVFIKPIELLLGFLFTNYFAITGNYGISLILMSVSVTLLTTPLYFLADTWKREEETLKRKMFPELASIKRHYTGQKRFYLIRNVHRLHGYSTLLTVRASFGLLIQIPFFFAAYHYLGHFEGYAGTRFLFINDLAKPDGFAWGVNLLPLLMTAVNLVSALMYSRSLSLRKNASLYSLALFFLVVLYESPAALLVYWTMNNALSLVKNLLFPSNRGVPAFREEETEEGALAAGLRTIRSLYGESLARPIAILTFTLVLAAQNWWLLRHAASYEYCVLLTGFAAAGAGAFWFIQMLRTHGFRDAIRTGFSRAITLAAVWLASGVCAYFLLFFRRQNAYISNPNIKILSVLLLDLCAYIAISGLLPGLPERDKGGKPERGRRIVFGAATIFLFSFVFFLLPLQVYFSSPADVGMSAWALVARNAVPFLLCVGALATIGIFRERRGYGPPDEAIVSVVVAAICYIFFSAGLYGILDDFALQRAFLLDQVSVGFLALDVLVVLFSAIAGRYLCRRRRGIVLPALIVFAAASTAQIGIQSTKVDPSDKLATAPAASTALPRQGVSSHRFSRVGENVVFIIADMCNGDYLGRIVKERPDLVESLDGFTWYPNTVSISAQTATSLPAIYGGWDYAPEKLKDLPGTGRDKLEAAAKKFFGGIAGMGFRMSAVDSLYVDPGEAETSKSEDYVGYWRAEKGAAGGAKLARNEKNTLLSMLSIFRAVPFMMKARIYDNGSWIVFRTSYQFDYIARKTATNYGYLDLLPELSSVADEGNTFKFIHTQFTHEPYGVKADGSIIDGDFPDPETKSFVDKKSAYYTARRFAEFLARWAEWMKAHGVYDNTFIIVVADHGNNTDDHGFVLPSALNDIMDREILSRVNPVLMVKRFGAEGPMAVDPRLMSNADCGAILFTALGEKKLYGDDPSIGTPQERTLPYSSLKGAWNDFLQNEAMEFSVYTVKGDMTDPANWSKK